MTISDTPQGACFSEKRSVRIPICWLEKELGLSNKMPAEDSAHREVGTLHAHCTYVMSVLAPGDLSNY